MSKRWTFFFVLLFVLLGCTLPASQETKYLKAGKVYGKTRGLFNHQWWNYFERGVSFAEGEFWAEAEADFLLAIKERKNDQRRARTYGMHFTDYFPHRELGVLYYRIGQYDRALQELLESLKNEESGKAKFYLNKTRKELISRQNADQAPPKITLFSPHDRLITNDAGLILSGKAEDDTYVTEIKINGWPLFNELAEKELPFTHRLDLAPGPNRLLVQATDIVGKIATIERTVVLDTNGPMVSLADIEPCADGSLLVTGSALDESAIVSFMINKTEIPAHGNEVTFIATLPSARLSFYARDEAGNVSEETLDLLAEEMKPLLGEKAHPVLLAANYLAGLRLPPMQLAAVITSDKGPVIQLKDIVDNETTFLDKTFIEGSAFAENQVFSISINETPLQFPPGKRVFFHQVALLAEGENLFTIAIKDAAGNETRERLTINKKVAKVKDIGSRMTLAVMPFAGSSSSAELSDLCFDLFQTHLHDLNRFHLVVRKDKDLEAVLTELKLNQSELVDPATAARVGKIVGAATIVNGTVFQQGGALEVTINHINTETTTLMTSLDVYAESTDLVSIKYLMNGLALKLQRHFPMLEGLIIKIKGGSYYLDLGKTSGLKPEMEVIAFREGAPIKHPVTGKVLGTDTEELGALVVTAVQDDFSIAKPQSMKPASIKEMDRIVTR